MILTPHSFRRNSSRRRRRVLRSRLQAARAKGTLPTETVSLNDLQGFCEVSRSYMRTQHKYLLRINPFLNVNHENISDCGAIIYLYANHEGFLTYVSGRIDCMTGLSSSFPLRA